MLNVKSIGFVNVHRVRAICHYEQRLLTSPGCMLNGKLKLADF